MQDDLRDNGEYVSGKWVLPRKNKEGPWRATQAKGEDER